MTTTAAQHMLIVGNSVVARQAAIMLETDDVITESARTGEEALARAGEATPDVVVIDQDVSGDMSAPEIAGKLRSQLGASSVVMIGDDVQPGPVLPKGVQLATLADYLRSRLKQSDKQPGAVEDVDEVAHRSAISPARISEEIHRELQRAELAGRPGFLAAVTVAELSQLRRRLGSQVEDVLMRLFDQLLAVDEPVLEQHSYRRGGELVVLMPETDLLTARARLQRLSRLIAGAAINISGERVRVTPVIGYASFTGADTASNLEEQADTALDNARLHLDLLPLAYSPQLSAVPEPAGMQRLQSILDRLRAPLQICFTFAVLLTLPFICYVVSWELGFDLTRVTYPLVAAALAFTALVLWIESFNAVGVIDEPPRPAEGYPDASAVIAAYLPNEAATILDTVTNMLAQDYPGRLQVILAYNTPQRLPVEDRLAEIAEADPRLLLLRVDSSTSKAQNINAALAHVNGEFVGIFDADHHPVPGSFGRAWGWLSQGNDIVQGHCVVRNGEASWVSRLVAVEFETIYAVSHPGRARLHGFGIFGGSNGYWRVESLRQIRMQGAMLTEDIDSSMRSLLDGFSIMSDPGLRSTELAPTTIKALWNQRMRWAQGWTQTAKRHLRPALTTRRLSVRQKWGATFLLGWTQVVPWVTVQVIPIVGFAVWRDRDLSGVPLLIPLFVLLTAFTFSVSIAQTVFAYLLGDPSVRRHRGWFALYAMHTMLWFGEFKNIISRVAQLKELSGERQWRVTPRTLETAPDVVVTENVEEFEDSLAS